METRMIVKPSRRSVMGGLAFVAATSSAASPVWAALPPPPIRLDTVFARAESAKGKGTRYANTSEPPSETLNSWPAGTHADCSGFVGWCFGLPRKPRQIGRDLKLGTNQIYEDAVSPSGKHLFAQTDMPLVGDIIVYPNYLYMPTRGDSGHVALLTARRADGHFEIIECASTPYHDPRVHEAIAFNRGEDVFRSHAELMLKVRQQYPDIPESMTRPPIYARYLGLLR